MTKKTREHLIVHSNHKMICNRLKKKKKEVPLWKPSQFGGFPLFDLQPCERASQRHPASIPLKSYIQHHSQRKRTHFNHSESHHTVLPPNGDFEGSVSTPSLTAVDCLDNPLGALKKSRMSNCEQIMPRVRTHCQTTNRNGSFSYGGWFRRKGKTSF